MSEAARLSTRSERIYQALLRVYPREFREPYGAQMVQTFGDLRGEEHRRRGAWGLVGLWARTLLDLVVTAVRMERSIVARKSPGSAVLLSLLLPGLGQIYNRQALKGLPWVLLSALYLASVAGLGQPGAFFGDGVVVVLVVSVLVLLPAQVWSMIDAYEVAKQTNVSASG